MISPNGGLLLYPFKPLLIQETTADFTDPSNPKNLPIPKGIVTVQTISPKKMHSIWNHLFHLFVFYPSGC